MQLTALLLTHSPTLSADVSGFFDRLVTSANSVLPGVCLFVCLSVYWRKLKQLLLTVYCLPLQTATSPFRRRRYLQRSGAS